MNTHTCTKTYLKLIFLTTTNCDAGLNLIDKEIQGPQIERIFFF